MLPPGGAPPAADRWWATRGRVDQEEPEDAAPVRSRQRVPTFSALTSTHRPGATRSRQRRPDRGAGSSGRRPELGTSCPNGRSGRGCRSRRAVQRVGYDVPERRPAELDDSAPATGRPWMSRIVSTQNDSFETLRHAAEASCSAREFTVFVDAVRDLAGLIPEHGLVRVDRLSRDRRRPERARSTRSQRPLLSAFQRKPVFGLYGRTPRRARPCRRRRGRSRRCSDAGSRARHGRSPCRRRGSGLRSSCRTRS